MDFRDYRDRLVEIDRMLDEGGIESAFIQSAAVEHAAELAGASAEVCERFARTSALALRCNVARELTGLSYREFSVRAAESSLLQLTQRLGLTALSREDANPEMACGADKIVEGGSGFVTRRCRDYTASRTAKRL